MCWEKSGLFCASFNAVILLTVPSFWGEGYDDGGKINQFNSLPKQEMKLKNAVCARFQYKLRACNFYIIFLNERKRFFQIVIA